jgi:membrane-associated phospholipid phosphatase
MMRIRARRVLPILALLALASAAGAQDFILEPLWDSIGVGAGLGVSGVSGILFHVRPAPDLGPADLSRVNAFDRVAAFGYSRGFDMAGDILEYTTIALPAVFSLFLSLEQSAQIGVVYLEVLSYAYSARSLLKMAFPRQRPWVYREAEYGPGPKDDPSYDSFPSGHATMVFAAAGFGVATFSAYFAILDYGLAALTAGSRVLAGMHFITDVLAGTVVGLVCGLLPPYLHLPPLAGAGGSRSLLPPVEVRLLTIEL